jgi:hypothetical protein
LANAPDLALLVGTDFFTTEVLTLRGLVWPDGGGRAS